MDRCAARALARQAQRQPQAGHGAAAVTGLDAGTAVMQARDLLHEWQAQARAAPSASGARQRIEALEYPIARIVRTARPPVGHLQAHALPVHLGLQRDLRTGW
ncbi:hypothetical protein G6F57_020053 [Rhizopus arrhizus]|nr:hypothetical protein G6F57_020053 [Rhizopus arrhizus]